MFEKLLSDSRLHEKKNGVSETSEGLPLLFAPFETKRQWKWRHEINEGRVRACVRSNTNVDRKIGGERGERTRSAFKQIEDMKLHHTKEGQIKHRDHLHPF